MRTSNAAAWLVLWAAGALMGQDACQFGFVSASSSATAAGSAGAVVVQSLRNLKPESAGCPAVLEPVAPWVRVVSHRAGAGAGTDFGYRVFENFERTARTATLRAGGATHQIQQAAGPYLGRMPRMAVRGSDGLVRLYEFAGTSVSTASGQAVASAPAVFQGSGCQVEMVARDTQNRLTANAFDGCTGQWLGWRNLGGTLAGRPALTQQAGGTMAAVARDPFGGYHLRRFLVGQTTGDWLALGGVFYSDPAVAADATGQVYIAGRDLWNALWVGRVNPTGQFLGWTYAGGLVRGQPSVAVGGDGIAYVATRDPWGGLHVLRTRNGSLLGWLRGEGNLASDPSIAPAGDGALYVAGLGADGGVVYRTFAEGTTSGWGPWTAAGGLGRHSAMVGMAGEALMAVVDAWNHLVWYRPTTGEWKNYGQQVAGAGMPGTAP